VVQAGQLEPACRVIELEDPEVRDQRHAAREQSRRAALVIAEDPAARARDPDRLDERERRVPRDVEQEVAMHVRDVGHAALARQTDRTSGRARDLDVLTRPLRSICAAAIVLVGDAAGLVVDVVGAVHRSRGTAPNRSRAPHRRRAASERQATSTYPPPVVNQRQAGRVGALGEQVGRDRERRQPHRRADAVVRCTHARASTHRLGGRGGLRRGVRGARAARQRPGRADARAGVPLQASRRRARSRRAPRASSAASARESAA